MSSFPSPRASSRKSITPGAPPRALVLLAAALATATCTAARAEGLRPYCPDRPGLATPPCTIDAGHVSAEIGLVDWTRDKTGATRTDTILAADTLLRIGVDDHAEVQTGWTAFGAVDELDRSSGTHDRSTRTGDVTVAIKRNLRHPDGAGAPLAMMPYATFPVGRAPIGGAREPRSERRHSGSSGRRRRSRRKRDPAGRRMRSSSTSATATRLNRWRGNS